MAAVCRSYVSHDEALKSVNNVLAGGIAGDAVKVLMGEHTRDAREAPVGEFAGTVAPDAPVGAFAGATHSHDETMGAFAGSGGRGGSFGDVDRDVVTTYPDGVERSRITVHSRLQELLTDAGLDEETARRDVKALHDGRILVLVQFADAGESDRIQSLLDA